MLKHLFNIHNLLAALLVFAVLKYFPIIFSLDMFDPIQNTLEEMSITDLVYSNLRDYDNVPIDSNIVIINNSHLRRHQLAAMFSLIDAENPKVIGVDIMLRKPKGDKFDKPLSEALQNIDNLILAAHNFKGKPDASGFDSVKYSNPMFSDYSYNAFVNMFTEPGEFRTVRKCLPKSFIKDSLVYSFATTIASFYDEEKTKSYLERNNQFEIVNYKRNIDKYLTIDAKEFFEKAENDELGFLEGKIVLVGYLGPNLKTPVFEDIFYSPMNPKFVGKAHPDMYGVVIHANIISMILEEDFLATTPTWLTYLIMTLLVYFNMVLLKYVRTAYPSYYQAFTAIIALGQLFIYTFIIIFSYHWFGVEIKIAGALFSVIVCVLSFELYNDSLYPLFRDLYRAIRFRITGKLV